MSYFVICLMLCSLVGDIFLPLFSPSRKIFFRLEGNAPNGKQKKKLLFQMTLLTQMDCSGEHSNSSWDGTFDCILSASSTFFLFQAQKFKLGFNWGLFFFCFSILFHVFCGNELRMMSKAECLRVRVLVNDTLITVPEIIVNYDY